MKRYCILFLIALLCLCSCNQRAQPIETAENDSITEFFRNFYTGCNDYYIQQNQADRENKSSSYRQYLTDNFISFLKGFCFDDIVADVYRKDLDIYEQHEIGTFNDSILSSLHVEKMADEKNVYIVHLQIDTLHIQKLYTLAKQNGKMKIYAVGKCKHPMVFCNDTLRIENSPQCSDAFYQWNGATISSNYTVADSLTLAKDYRVAVLEPSFTSIKDRHEPQIYSDRLLLVIYKNRRMVYNNIISNEEKLAGWHPHESLAKPAEEEAENFLERCDFILSYSAGMGYKVYYTIGIKVIESKPYVIGIRWEEHDSGLSFHKQIIQEYNDKEMPLSSYNRSMPWELSQGM